jgi:hypothetical protein
MGTVLAPAGPRTVTVTLRPVPATDEGSAAEPGSLPDSLWPLGDEVATALLGLLEVELRGRGLRWRVVARERLEVGRTDLPWPGTPVDLAPLCERMRDRVKADWPELIEQYVSDLRTSAARSAFALGESSWRRAMEPLRARILPADTTHAALGGALQRLVVDGLVEAIVTEAPPAARIPRNGERGDGRANYSGRGPGAPTGAGYEAGAESGIGTGIGGELVSAGDALDWGVAEHVLFDAARANVRRDTALEAERFTIDGTELIALFSPSHYAATHVLWLAEHLAGLPGYVEANGVLVVLPHRHLITVHPIESSAVVAAAGTLLRFAARQFETCPGPISDQLYWWQGGTLSRLPSDSVGETLQLFPSDRFAALLDRLRVGRRPGDEPPPGVV